MVDATFGAPAHRDAFLAGLLQSDHDRLPEGVRQLGDDRAEPPAAHRLAVSTDGCAQDLADRVATWIEGSP